jgi:hypothetical protein
LKQRRFTRKTDPIETATLTLRRIDRWRSLATAYQLSHPGDGVERLLPQFRSQRYLLPSSCRGIVEKATRNVAAEHIFQGQGLGAELDVIITPVASPSLFVFDRIDLS